MKTRDRLIGTANIVVRVALVANRLFLAAVAAAITLTWIFPAQFASFLVASNAIADVRREVIGIHLLMLTGILMAIATDRLLSALSLIIASAGVGDPFIAINAARLRTIGWCLLALQLLDFPCVLLTRYFPSLGSAAPNGDISFGGWAAVLMVFVLSRVFAAGTAMRDELEATV